MKKGLNLEFQKLLENGEAIAKFQKWDESLDTPDALYNWPIRKQLKKLQEDCLPASKDENSWLSKLIKNSDEKEPAEQIVKNTLAMRDEMKTILVSLDPQDKDSRNKLALWIIRDWGGIQSGARVGNLPDTGTTQTDEKLSDLLDEIENEENLKETAKEFNFERIASWSKYLAFKYPQKYGIYDARVVYSLNWLLLKAGSTVFFPFLDGQNSVLSLLDYRAKLYLKLHGKKKFQEELGNDVKSRMENPGKKSRLKSELEKGVFINKKDAYWQYALLLQALSNVCTKDGVHGVTRIEMILFSLADKLIAEEVMQSFGGVEGVRNQHLPDMNVEITKNIFSGVYDGKGDAKDSDDRIHALCNILYASQRYNYRFRQSDVKQLFPLLNPLFHFEINSEGTTLWLSLALAIQEMYGLSDESLISLLRPLQSGNER
ncbi:MAG: hypothetical protein PHH47_07580 [Gallionella sp.]|nr:hypothetical protein [Gallionella sp.]MDD4945350.1 hypothetical protein [Gallionella sp.]MDD5612098.1 hypothetical protein [Gallionella sp.]